MARESHWRNMPRNFTKREVLDSLGESKNWRNPFRIPEMEKGWPHTGRASDYEKILSTASDPIPYARKGRPI